MASGEQSRGAQHGWLARGTRPNPPAKPTGASATGSSGILLRVPRAGVSWEAGEVQAAEAGSGKERSSRTWGVIQESQQSCGALSLQGARLACLAVAAVTLM